MRVLEVAPRAIDGLRVRDSDALLLPSTGRATNRKNCTVREPLRRVHEAILELLNKFTITDLAESPAVKLTPLPLPLNPAPHASIRN